MTHTNHRQGSREDLSHDFVAMIMGARGINTEGGVEKTRRFFEMAKKYNPVNAGHWGETPEFAHTMSQWLHFELPNTPESWREDLLRRTRVRYIIFSQKPDETGSPTEAQLLLVHFEIAAAVVSALEDDGESDVHWGSPIRKGVRQ